MGNQRLWCIPALVLLLAACSDIPRNPFLSDFSDKGKKDPVITAPQAIASVHLTITSPATGETPDIAAHGHEADNFTIGNVSWNPDHAVFIVYTAYTATVTLTAKQGYTFEGIAEAYINGTGASITNNTGSAITLSHTFSETKKEVTSITIKTQPNLIYVHDNALDLSDLVVTLTHNDGAEDDVTFNDFDEYNIYTEPEHDDILSHTDHDGTSVKVELGHLSKNTDALTVDKANPTVEWPTGLKIISGTTLADMALPGNGTGAGAFTWTDSTLSVGAVGTRTFNMTFTPGDTTNYNTRTSDVLITVVQSIIETIRINAGTFTMGSPTSEPGRTADRETQHPVTFTSGFYMGKYPVTQAQYQKVMGTNPSAHRAGGSRASYVTGLNTDNFPVEQVSWYDDIVFCNKLSMLEGLIPAYRINNSTDPAVWGTVPTSSNATWNAVEIVTGSTGYRLPTEAQWEYACRAGRTQAFNWGTNTINSTQANYYASYVDACNLTAGTNLNRTTAVGSYAANAWGLYDIHGNVFELCQDWYDANYGSVNATDAQTNPTGAVSGTERVRRGGGCGAYGQNTRSACRNGGTTPYYRNYTHGIRVVRP